MDLIGRRFGRLIVIGYAGHSKNGADMWFCECECGVITTVCQSNLLRGKSKSCGCLLPDRIRNYIRRININGKRNHEGDQQ